MNLREGTRRLALLLGVMGAILGGIASSVELQTVLSQRARQNTFERFTTSKTVQQARASWPLAIRYTPGKAIEALRSLSEEQQRDVISSLDRDERIDLMAKLKCASSQFGTQSTAAVMGNLSQVDRWAQYAQDDPYACLAEPIDPPISTANGGGIKAIHWTKTLGVESIETDDGHTLYPTTAPPKWTYLLIALFPFVGFFIPWGATRAIGWAGAGFVQPSK